MQSPAKHGIVNPLARLFLWLLFCLPHVHVAQSREIAALNEALGFNKNDKLLIVNHDDVGMNFETNQAFLESYRLNPNRNATVMVPCPWFSHIAQKASSNKIPPGIKIRVIRVTSRYTC